jgi:hypothetical protein
LRLQSIRRSVVEGCLRALARFPMASPDARGTSANQLGCTNFSPPCPQTLPSILFVDLDSTGCPLWTTMWVKSIPPASLPLGVSCDGRMFASPEGESQPCDGVRGPAYVGFTAEGGRREACVGLCGVYCASLRVPVCRCVRVRRHVRLVHISA